MKTYEVSKTFGWQGKVTEKVANVMRMFGVTADRLVDGQVEHNADSIFVTVTLYTSQDPRELVKVFC